MSIEKIYLKQNPNVEQNETNIQYDPIKNEMRGIKPIGAIDKDEVTFSGEEQPKKSNNGILPYLLGAGAIITVIACHKKIGSFFKSLKKPPTAVGEGSLKDASKINEGINVGNSTASTNETTQSVVNESLVHPKVIEMGGPKEPLLLPAPTQLNKNESLVHQEVIEMSGPKKPLLLPAPTQLKANESLVHPEVIEMVGPKEKLALPDPNQKPVKLATVKSPKVEKLTSELDSLATARTQIAQDLSTISTKTQKIDFRIKKVNNALKQAKEDLVKIKNREELNAHKIKIDKLIKERADLSKASSSLKSQEDLLNGKLEKLGENIKSTLGKTSEVVKKERKESLIEKFKAKKILAKEKGKLEKILTKAQEKETNRLDSETQKMIKKLDKLGI